MKPAKERKQQRKEDRRVRRRNNLILLAWIVAVAAFLLFMGSVQEVLELDMKLQVGNYAGFALGENKIDFGTVLPGGHAKREVVITNDDTRKGYFQIRIEAEDWKEWIVADDRWLSLKPGETRKISFHVNVPGAARLGNYTGSVKVMVRRIPLPNRENI